MRDKRAHDVGRIGDRLDQRIGDDRHHWRLHGDLCQRRGHRVGCRLHQRAVEGRGDGQHHGAPSAPFFRDLDGAFDRRLVARHHDLSAAIVVRGLANLPLRGLRRDRRRLIEVKPEQCRHAAGAHRHRLLHSPTANAQEPRGVGNGERASGGER